MRLSRLRPGELIALIGALSEVVALTLPWYQNAEGKLGAWSTFGTAVALLILATAVALLLAVATLAERSAALPVALGVWGTFFGFVAVAAAVVRVLERPQHSNMLCAGAWLALAGAVAILVGSWQSLRDERTELYAPPEAELRRLPEQKQDTRHR